MMKYCDNVNCEWADVPLERISDYRIIDGAVVLCTGCAEEMEYEEQVNAANVPDSGHQDYDAEVGIL
jgi:hypothetical protein